MALDRKLADWQAAGLIDAATADAISAHEAIESRPAARWAAIAIGLLALALGLSLVIAANWDIIPKAAKLSVHAVFLICTAVTIWLDRRPMVREAGLFLLGALILAGLSLQDQIYQVPQPLWSLFGLSALLVAPAVLIAGTTRLTAIAWSLLLVAAALAYVTAVPRSLGFQALLAGNLAAALPPALILLSLLARARPAFAAGVRDTGLGVLLIGASLAHFAWAVAVRTDDAVSLLMRLPLGLAATAAAVGLAARAEPGERRVLRTALLAAAGATLLAVGMPHPDALAAHLIGALAFLFLWALVAQAAGAGGWHALFGAAVAMIALRLFLIYFELFGSLASTGLGLVAGGVLVIGLGVAWDRIVRRRGR